jgi:hypothetical protein
MMAPVHYTVVTEIKERNLSVEDITALNRVYVAVEFKDPATFFGFLISTMRSAFRVLVYHRNTNQSQPRTHDEYRCRYIS